jgi:hypothetical protein
LVDINVSKVHIVSIFRAKVETGGVTTKKTNIDSSPPLIPHIGTICSHGNKVTDDDSLLEYSAVSQKVVIFILAAVRTLNIT